MVMRGTIREGGVGSDRSLWRMLIAVIFVASLVGSFALGRMRDPVTFTHAPSQPWAEVAHPGSGHVPRHWAELPQQCRGCRPAAY